MYIYAFSDYTDIVIDKLQDKKSMLTKRFSRSDNFINLALLGAQQCMKDIEIDKQSSIYIASRNGNINSTIKVLDAIFLQDRLPMPFNFLNSVNASTLFFIAQNFNIEGKTVFVDKFESALIQAFVDVQNGKTVLIGTVEEAISDLALHQKKFGLQNIKEHSKWLLISSKLLNHKPIAQIFNIQLNINNQTKNSKSNLFDFFVAENDSFDFIGENLLFSIKKMI